jgi:methionyl-tRNA synthetase
MDLSLDDFVNRYDEVVHKVVNLASRSAALIARSGGRLAPELAEPELYAEFAAARAPIGALYEAADFAAAIRAITALAVRANQYFDARKPWSLAKDPARAAETVAVCTQALNLFRVLMSYLAPVLPAMAERAAAFLGRPFRHWEDVATPLLGVPLAPYEPLATRLDPKVVATLIEAEGVEPAAVARAAAAPAPAAAEITVDDFARVDLRVARVVAADHVEGADKLLRLTLDLGTEQRTVFAGIKSGYAPEQLVGRHVVVIANLKPRKMRFGVSQGMVLAASGDGPGVFLVGPDAGAIAGMTVK